MKGLYGDLNECVYNITYMGNGIIHANQTLYRHNFFKGWILTLGIKIKSFRLGNHEAHYGFVPLYEVSCTRKTVTEMAAGPIILMLVDRIGTVII